MLLTYEAVMFLIISREINGIFLRILFQNIEGKLYFNMYSFKKNENFESLNVV